jgi:putative membrane protein
MGDMVVRSSTKAIKVLYVFYLLVAAAIIAFSQWSGKRLEPLLIVPALDLLWIATRHVGLRYTTMTVTANRLSFEQGIMSRTSRTLDLAKIQDVKVDQSLGQRILNLGNLTLQTAGETSTLTMTNIDSPRLVADRILGASARGA